MLGSLFHRIFPSRAVHARQKLVTVEAMRQGWTAFLAGRFSDAESAANVVLSTSQIEAELKTDALCLRAHARSKLGCLQGALEDYRLALQITPGSIDNLLGQGEVLHALNRFEDALAAAEAVLELDTRHAVAHNNRGLMLRELGQLGEAMTALRRAVQCNEEFHDARVNLARVLSELGKLDEAESELSKIISSDKDHVGARWNLAMINLLRGNFAEGWRDYEARFQLQAIFSTRPHKYPQWDGNLLSEGTLLIYGEQGLGDDILFASCYEDAMAKVGQCIIECEPRLERLFMRSFPRARIVGSKFQLCPDWANSGLRVSAQIAAGSLPGLFRDCLEDFPVHRGYLKVDPEEVAGWRARLDTLGSGLKVGISWVGGTPRTRRATRSIALQSWLPILDATEAQFVSLQYGDCVADIAALTARSGIQVHHWPEVIADYDKTAALVSALDLVISVTTSIVHLAGALGQRVWVLVPANPEWRYMSSGDTMPWYPSARLFRQSVIGEWSEAMREVGRALKDYAHTAQPESGTQAE